MKYILNNQKIYFKKTQLFTQLPKQETDLGNDKELLSLPSNLALKTSSDKKRSDHTVNPTDELEMKFTKLLSQSEQIIVPRNIKLLQEYDAAIGRDGKSFIPAEHTAMIGYGADDDTGRATEDFMKLTNWHAMIIGPQEVFLFSFSHFSFPPSSLRIFISSPS